MRNRTVQPTGARQSDQPMTRLITAEHKEVVENTIDVLCSCLSIPAGRSEFEKNDGVDLALILAQFAELALCIPIASPLSLSHTNTENNPSSSIHASSCFHSHSTTASQIAHVSFSEMGSKSSFQPSIQMCLSSFRSSSLFPPPLLLVCSRRYEEEKNISSSARWFVLHPTHLYSLSVPSEHILTILVQLCRLLTGMERLRFLNKFTFVSSSFIYSSLLLLFSFVQRKQLPKDSAAS